MFAVVRTGGKQYRVAPGDKIVVEKLDGNAGDKITLGDVLLAGEGSNLKSTNGLTVAAEIVAQAKGDKVTVFKKRRRHNYRRKQGHRQLHTILKIVAIGDHKHVPSKAEGEDKKHAVKTEAKPAPASETKATPKPEAAPSAQSRETPAATAKSRTKATSEEHESLENTGQPTENPAPNNDKAAGAEKPVAKKAAAAKAAAKSPSTKNAAPAKGGPKKTPKAK
jgi:large subunit ribosomal protein L21